MKWLCTIVLGLGMAATQSAAQDTGKSDARKPGSSFKTLKEKVSYGIGMNIGRQFSRQGLDVDPKVLARGLADVLGGKKPLLTEQELEAAFAEYQKVMRAKQDQQRKSAAEKNKRQGAAFLKANARKAGVKTTRSGLQYKSLKAGSGKSPKATDKVTVHYHGTLIDGTVFDSSVQRGRPATFPLDGVIKGWTEGVQLMKVGAKFRLFVPSELAYGANPRGGKIGPHAVLIFDVELLSIGE